MSKKNELKFVFHNPNTPKETEEYLTQWVARLCVPEIEKLVFEKEALGEDGREGEFKFE